MKRVIFNIGLNNNPFADVVMAKFSQRIEAMTMIDNSIKVGVYNGVEEPTAVIICYTVMTNGDIIKMTESLCEQMTQECIAIKIDNIGHLVYRPDFEGERYEFDEKYFLI